MASPNRIKIEIEDIRRDPHCTIKVAQDPSNPFHLTGSVKGPDATPYAKGTFDIDIQIPSDYPFSPPKMKFITRVWHPNISSQTGFICLDILKDQWSPALTLKTTLISLQALLCTAEPSDPQDAVVAEMYKTNHKLFEEVAKFWTECYAMPPGSQTDNHPALQRLMDMGFAREAARDALLKHKLNETEAIEALISEM